MIALTQPALGDAPADAIRARVERLRRLRGVKWLTVAGLGLLFGSLILNVLSGQLSHALPWLTLSVAMGYVSGPVLGASAVIWLFKRVARRFERARTTDA